MVKAGREGMLFLIKKEGIGEVRGFGGMRSEGQGVRNKVMARRRRRRWWE